MKPNIKKMIKPNMTFKPSLFAEGMRQLKTGGIIYSVICAVFSLLAVISQLNASSYSNEHYQHKAVFTILPNLNTLLESHLTMIMPIFAIAACLVLYSFMRSSAARDFYSSLPYSSGTVWLSFTVSILTWTFIGIAAYAVIQLPFLALVDPSFLPNWLVCIATVLAVTVFGCGVITLAASLTGKMLPLIITAAGFFVMPDSLCFAFNIVKYVHYGNYTFYDHSSDPFADGLIYSYLRFAMSENVIKLGTMSYGVMISSFLLIGTAYFTIAAFFMNMRTGDAAGNAFTNEAAHHLSHMVVNTLPFAILLLLFTDLLIWLINGWGDVVSEVLFPSLLIIIGFLMSYWISDLLLTFDLSKSLKSLITIPVTLIITIAVTVAGGIFTYMDFNQAPKPDEISSLILDKNYNLTDELVVFRLQNSYGRTLTMEHEITDQKLIEIVSKRLSREIICGKFFDNKIGLDATYEDVRFKINLKNGKTITRIISADQELYDLLYKSLTGDAEFMKKIITLPEPENLNISIENADGISPDDAMEIYNIFRSEFDALPLETKLERIKNSALKNYSYVGSEDYYAEAESEDYDADKNDYTNKDEYADVFENVTASDIAVEEKGFFLADSHCKRGDFHADTIDLYDAGAKGYEIIAMNFAGYGEGHKYDNNYYFEHSFFPIISDDFPKTFDAIIKATHKNAEKLNEYANDPKSMDVNVEYHGKNDGILMSYAYFSRSMADYEKREKDSYFDHLDLQEDYYYDDENDEICPLYSRKRVDINGLEQIKRLINDIPSSENIDFSKPYCLVNLNLDKKQYSFYLQTESPTDIYADKIAAVVAAQSAETSRNIG